ncbi:MAG: 3-hydroxyacyl-CoA dehydrogenase family protein [Acidaminococcales bacterium]|jgi:3-hydroxybutyryl-CoA dehydrogenase|nr:3-hydroxyacyl-CoA dehydrogenase family protein [Acidaminococcales bacterium]
MKGKDIKKTCVVGGGLMGRQIALNNALHGYDTYIYDCAADVIEKVRIWTDEYLKDRIAKGRMTESETKKILEKFHLAASLEEAAQSAQIVIEAIIEDKDSKRGLFKKLNAIVDNDCVIASNSSYMPSSLFVDCVDNSARLANLHYFNPALVLKLTEVVQGSHCSEETAQCLIDFSRKTGKTPIWLKKECDGFVVNRCLRALRQEAFAILEEGICSPQEIDIGLELGLSHPMGPFRLNDLTGIDLSYHANERIYKETGLKPKGYDIIKAKYEAKEWGRKTGKGWYDYSK